MDYGKRILNLRIRKGVSQVEMAKLIDVDSSLYSRYEKDKQTIPIKHLNTICNFFDVSLDYIFGFTDLMQYDKTLKEIDAIKSGERLKQFRKERKLTQEKLANILNTVHQVISKYEKGINLIATPFLYTICSKYKVSADYLLGRTDGPIYFDKVKEN